MLYLFILNTCYVTHPHGSHSPIIKTRRLSAFFTVSLTACVMKHVHAASQSDGKNTSFIYYAQLYSVTKNNTIVTIEHRHTDIFVNFEL